MATDWGWKISPMRRLNSPVPLSPSEGSHVVTAIVVDDTEDVRATVASALEADGWVVHQYPDASPVFDAPELTDADLVVCDLSMPTPGDTLLETLHARGIEVPIVMMSGDFAGREAELVRKGARGLLKKPFRLADLLSMARDLVPTHVQ